MPMICDEFISKMDITEERFRTLEDMLMKTYQIEKQREKLMKKKWNRISRNNKETKYQ